MEGGLAIIMSIKYDIPNYGKFIITLPDASSVFEDIDDGKYNSDKIRAVESAIDTWEDASEAVGPLHNIAKGEIAKLERERFRLSDKRRVYKGRELEFLLAGPFSFDITADYQKGGLGGSAVGGVVDTISSVLSSVGPTGVISQRSATLTYKNSKISGFNLPFVLLSEGDKYPITDDLDALYRAVLPTFGETGQYSVTEGGVVNVVGEIMSNWGLVTIDKGEHDNAVSYIASEGGAITSRAAKALNLATSTLNEYYGVYGQTAPLSYDPTILSDIKGTVGLSIGDYFKCERDLVITKVDVKFSQACDTNGHPLYAEGNIMFSFVKPIDHRAFRLLFQSVGTNNVISTEMGSNSFFNQEAVEKFKGLATNLKDIVFGK